MAFLSSVFSKLTETTNLGSTKENSSTEGQLSLSCEGEVDDFVLFSKNENSNSKQQDSGPPMYNEVMSLDNRTPHLPYSVNPIQPNPGQLPAYSELLKKSPIDDVPFNLWNSHMTMCQATGLLQETNSILDRSKSICGVNISSRYHYSFQLELTVLKELSDSSFEVLQELYCEKNDKDNMLIDLEFDKPGLESTSKQEPRIGCLVDI